MSSENSDDESSSESGSDEKLVAGSDSDDDISSSDDDESLVTVQPSASIEVPDVVCDESEEEMKRVTSFKCSCKHFNGKSCYEQFTSDFIMNRRLEMNSLSQGNSYVMCIIWSMSEIKLM